MNNMIQNMKNECVGCSACVNSCPQNCIEMVQDEYGFSYPAINENQCINCGRCSKICPVDYRNKGKNYENIPVVISAYSRNEEERKRSSSGGIFSRISDWVLSKDGIIIGAIYTQDGSVIHAQIENAEDLEKLRGAKYSESCLGNIFEKVYETLKIGKYVLFSGTPCQVAGLKSFLKKDYDNLICVDFVCHGVPSPMAWKEYLKYRMKEDQEEELPVSINLRSKKTGWSRYQYSTEFRYADGKEYSCKNGENLFMKLFVGDYINRKSCSDCQFKGYSRVSDFTLGDFWGIWDIDPEMDDNKGTSLVLVQSEKAKMLWKEIASEICYKEVTLEQASMQNPSLLVSSKAKENREEILEMIRNGRIAECEKLFVAENVTLKERILRKIKNILY